MRRATSRSVNRLETPAWRRRRPTLSCARRPAGSAWTPSTRSWIRSPSDHVRCLMSCLRLRRATPVRKVPHHARGDLPLHPAGLARRERLPVRSQKTLGEGERGAPCEAELPARHQQAGRAASQVPGAGRERGFVEVVEVEVLEPVVARERAEVLDVQVAANPRERGVVQWRGARPVLVEEVAGAAEEREGTLPHALVLPMQALGVTTLIEATDPLRHAFRHAAEASRDRVALSRAFAVGMRRMRRHVGRADRQVDICNGRTRERIPGVAELWPNHRHSCAPSAKCSGSGEPQSPAFPRVATR